MADEVRLIDANALESIIQEQVGKCMIKVFEPSVNLILQDIRNAPTIEAEPVKHGRWIRKHNSFPQRYFCTECGGGDVGRFAFCHHCGARMRMGGDGDD